MSMAAAEAPTRREGFVKTGVNGARGMYSWRLTDEAKNVSDGGDEDDQGVGSA